MALLFWWIHQNAWPATGTVPASLGELLREKSAVATTLFNRLSAVQALVFGALMATVGQLGDLIESVFKRTVGAKDSAALLPSFGGILDLLDSPIAAAPVAWIMLTFIWQVV
jgi:phosphatidate cytidylyltransferase